MVDGCFKDPGLAVCVGVAACDCYDDGGCNGDLICDVESICRRADCRPGQEECACVDGQCLGGLVCDGKSCRMPGGDGVADGGDDGDGADDRGTTSAADDGNVDNGVTSNGDGMVTTTPLTTAANTDDGMDEAEVGEVTGSDTDILMCEPLPGAQPWSCGWVEVPGWYDCNGGGACGPVERNPLECPDGLVTGSPCTGTTIINPIQGCCMPNGDVAFCDAEGASALIVGCAPPDATSG